MDTEFLQRCITVLNEMASNPFYYKYQECPLTILFPDEDYGDKHSACVVGLDLDIVKIQNIRYNQIHHLKHGFIGPGWRIGDQSPDPGIQEPLGLGHITTYFDEDPYAVGDMRLRFAFHNYFHYIDKIYDILRNDNYIPRFVLGSVRIEDNPPGGGVFLCISSWFAYENSESLVQ
jgi:hypothetical protein